MWAAMVNQNHPRERKNKMKMLTMAAVLAVGMLFNTGCACCHKGGSCDKTAMKCDGGCCKGSATCAKCCADAAGCAKCCHKS